MTYLTLIAARLFTLITIFLRSIIGIWLLASSLQLLGVEDIVGFSVHFRWAYVFILFSCAYIAQIFKIKISPKEDASTLVTSKPNPYLL